jgi:hypothetical protein
MYLSRLLAALLATLAAVGCASGPADQLGPPDLVPAAGVAAPPQSRFYADCIAQAVTARTYDREGNTLRFRCQDAPARVFYEGLAGWTAKIGAELTANGATWRMTQPIRRNLTGLDHCVLEASGRHRCTVVLNVGEFLGFKAP